MHTGGVTRSSKGLEWTHAAILSCVTHEHGGADLMPGAALGSDLKHAALEGSAVPIEEQGRERAHRVRGNVTEHGAMEFDRDGLLVVELVHLGHMAVRKVIG